MEASVLEDCIVSSTTEPVYDYPYQKSAHSPTPRGSPTTVTITDRLLLTQTVWFHPTVNSATALHILQREPPGTFLVRKSNTQQQMALCVRLSDDHGQSFIHQTFMNESSAGIYRGFCLDVIKNRYECELQGAKQHLEVSWMLSGAWITL
ncbi:ras and Rab interactor 1 [Pelobates cultripes]|uniref:Ras and Rab interactor 1 n=1 Tax=Pelobates cultripes TaxID=61616 RepID=A0AAD1TI82_PELCU|nr:ras and Rab interactor 1 [Pelobates cultripes]